MLRAFDRRLSRFSTALRSGDNHGCNIYTHPPTPSAARSAGHPSGARVERSTTVAAGGMCPCKFGKRDDAPVIWAKWDELTCYFDFHIEKRASAPTFWENVRTYPKGNMKE